jgi:AAT family amino acid transporter
MLTMFFYTVLIVPFWGMLWEANFGKAYAMNTPWWEGIAGTPHVSWVFGWWEWMIIVLFMTPNVWRMKPWTLITLPQPWKGIVSFIGKVILGYLLAWHHYFDDQCPMADKDSWGAFWYRTIGVLVLMAISYVLYYLVNFGHWGLGIHPMAVDLAERYIGGESLVWNFWWIIPLLWNEWFFHKWPFYVHDEH